MTSTNPTMRELDRKEQRRAELVAIGKMALLLALLCAGFALPFMHWGPP